VSYATSTIKSIQRGVISITGTNQTATATITSVDTAKSVVISSGTRQWRQDGWSVSLSPDAYLTLTNSTTVTVTRFYSAGSPSAVQTDMPWQVVEYY
jgi:hypothetical protein